MGRIAFTNLVIALLFPACVVEAPEDDDGMGSETSAASSNGPEEGADDEGAEEKL